MNRSGPVGRGGYDALQGGGGSAGGGGGGGPTAPLPGTSAETWATNTVDTGALFRGIMLSDGTVKAIPFDVTPPAAPQNFARVVGLTSVNLSWDAVAGAVKYLIYRDGTKISETTSVRTRDTTVVVGHTYSYQVSSVDQYLQVSQRSTAVTAVIDVSLNHAPQEVSIRCWPTPLPTDGPAFVRVNAHEIDVQNMAFLLNVDAGSLRATNDPSVWIIQI